MTINYRALAYLAVALPLVGCVATPAPDYALRAVTDEKGEVIDLIPPECPNWREFSNSRLENQYGVQFGCAHAHNLAAQVDRKKDVIEGEPMGESDGTYTAATIKNYRAGKTKPLINAWDDKPTQATPTGAGETP